MDTRTVERTGGGGVRVAWLTLVVAFVLAACGETVGAPAMAPTSSTVPPTTTKTSLAPPPTTSTSSTTTTTPPEPLLLVAFGDSFATASGWPSQYAALASTELDRDVQVGGEVCALGCGLLSVLQRADTRELIRKADILVVQPRPGRVFSVPFRKYLEGTCGGDDGQECIRTSLEEFRVYVHELLDAATATADEDTVIRTVPAGVWALDYFYPGLRDEDPEAFAVFVGAMAGYIRLVEEDSTGRCILTVDASALFNGDDYMEPIDPANTEDGAHPSEQGARIVAEQLHSLGYEPTAQSC